ncbi:MAG: hypothetical protein AB2598_19505, partial [Candidatus Thiodiazotropha sp.]
MDKLPHILLPNQPETHLYTSTGSRGDKKPPVPRNRIQHGTFLQNRFKRAWEESENTHLAIVGARNGVYLEFISDPDAELVTKSLEDMRSKDVRLLNIK